MADVNNPSIKSIMDEFEIKQFPSFILFDAQANPVRCLIGYNWF